LRQISSDVADKKLDRKFMQAVIGFDLLRQHVFIARFLMVLVKGTIATETPFFGPAALDP
jgi:hypothetical protein